MMRLQHLYDLAVLWLLSVAAKRAAETIYQHGHDDGANELRDFMRRELQAVQVAAVTERMRAYNHGFADGVRLCEDEPRTTAPTEWVM